MQYLSSLSAAKFDFHIVQWFLILWSAQQHYQPSTGHLDIQAVRPYPRPAESETFGNWEHFKKTFGHSDA